MPTSSLYEGWGEQLDLVRLDRPRSNAHTKKLDYRKLGPDNPVKRGPDNPILWVKTPVTLLRACHPEPFYSLGIFSIRPDNPVDGLPDNPVMLMAGLSGADLIVPVES